MRFLLAAMLIIFLLSGVIVLTVSARELVRKLTRWRRFERANGVVVEVRSKTLRLTTTSKLKSTVMHFPVVTFSTRRGDAVTFTSETGDSGPRSRYAPGQRLVVVYDPDGEVGPMLDTWSGMWLSNVMAVVAGVVFMAGALLIAWAFGDRMLGR